MMTFILKLTHEAPRKLMRKARLNLRAGMTVKGSYAYNTLRNFASEDGGENPPIPTTVL
jgi:hypothetical protein